jgi:putative hemolysin
MPVISRETGEVVGIVLMADAFRAVSRREPIDLRVMVQDVPVVSDRAEAIDAIEVLHRSAHHFAFVYDEYGHFEGLITTADVLEAITGSIDARAGRWRLSGCRMDASRRILRPAQPAARDCWRI